jgi:response regulator RpfG family c-di-GMP phosphodiesterase
VNILIVDDNPTNLHMFRVLVGKFAECIPVPIDAPTAALDWCASNTPDLVLLDYMMPEIDGIEFLLRFRQLPGKADIPVIMVTADHEKEVRHRALEAGANDFLNKPIDKVEFLARVKNMLALRRGQKHLADHAAWLAEEVRKALKDVADREREAIFLLAKAAEYRDPETGAHILRMAHYSRLIGSQLGLPDSELDLLLEAAPMHDIGKVGIPDVILLKPGRLDADEFAIMKQHAEIGRKILQGHTSSNQMLRMAAGIAITHHEKFDGSGYPYGLSGADIPLVGRIVAVADVFDALTSARPYKRAWPLEDAKRFLVENSGSHFDPVCVTAFLDCWDDAMAIRARFRDEEAESGGH